MSLDDAAFQWALARLLTEPALADGLLREPSAVAAQLGLDEGQIQGLAVAGGGRLRAFAHSLAGKRMGLLRKTCPATDTLLHQRGRQRELAARFLREHPPLEAREYPNRSLRDGFWMTALLMRMQADGELNDPLLADVARFEHTLLTVTSLSEALESAAAWDLAAHAGAPATEGAAVWDVYPTCGPHVRIERFVCDVVVAVRRLSEGQPVGRPDDTPCLILFSKQPGWRNVRYASVNALTHALLLLCDGGTTIGGIVERLGATRDGAEPAAFARDCLATLLKLRDINVLRFATTAAFTPASP
jgi:hypothetical protein